jgi:hypothetical protein
LETRTGGDVTVFFKWTAEEILIPLERIVLIADIGPVAVGCQGNGMYVELR